jgi:alkylation response protein AidB-like acyl-CoA dehydrogenase
MNFDLTDDQIKLQSTVWDFANGEVAPRAAQMDREGTFPVELYQAAGRIGIHCLQAPRPSSTSSRRLTPAALRSQVPAPTPLFLSSLRRTLLVGVRGSCGSTSI